MKAAEHEHPLTLIDLQVQYQEQEEDVEEDDEEAGDLITKEVFHVVKCERCGQVISMYHRYYYTCVGSTCHFSIHKFCGELPERLDHPLHQHPLIQFPEMWKYHWTCCICESSHIPGEVGYHCSESVCYFPIDVKCDVEVGKKTIHHPSHPHSLTCLIPEPILCKCRACGKEHKGVFYLCTTCNGFAIHSDCAFLPQTLLIQDTTYDAFHHTHPLTLSYSFPFPDQKAKHYPDCRVCDATFIDYLWIFKCDKCMYYAHLDCATSRTSAGFGKTINNYKDADHPHLLHLPFPDETYSIPKHMFFQETGTSYDLEVNLTHASHQHPLFLVDLRRCNEQISSSSSKVIDPSLLLNKCHDPMKKTQLLCNGCLRPITSTMPFCTCDQPICNFALHEWCTRLPQQIDHPKHPQHPLLLKYPNDLPHHFYGVFWCNACNLPCNGFAYCCVICEYYVDVTCGLSPKHITHESHPNHLLSLSVQLRHRKYCHMCLHYLFSGELSFSCKSCDVIIHPSCALLLPKAIRHKYDKHPMQLSYLPIENHKSQYFCEICEKDLNPKESFYHCQDCAQSVHAACAPLILQSETETHSQYWYGENIYDFVNIKFGGIFNTNRHQHALSFAQGTVLDG